MSWMDEFGGGPGNDFPYPKDFEPLADFDDIEVGAKSKAVCKGTFVCRGMRSGARKDGSGYVFNVYVQALDTNADEYKGAAEKALWVDLEKLNAGFRQKKNLATAIQFGVGMGLVDLEDYAEEPDAEMVKKLAREIEAGRSTPKTFSGAIFWERKKFQGDDGPVEYETNGLYSPNTDSFEDYDEAPF